MGILAAAGAVKIGAHARRVLVSACRSGPDARPAGFDAVEATPETLFDTIASVMFIGDGTGMRHGLR